MLRCWLLAIIILLLAENFARRRVYKMQSPTRIADDRLICVIRRRRFLSCNALRGLASIRAAEENRGHLMLRRNPFNVVMPQASTLFPYGITGLTPESVPRSVATRQ